MPPLQPQSHISLLNKWRNNAIFSPLYIRFIYRSSVKSVRFGERLYFVQCCHRVCIRRRDHCRSSTSCSEPVTSSLQPSWWSLSAATSLSHSATARDVTQEIHREPRLLVPMERLAGGRLAECSGFFDQQSIVFKVTSVPTASEEAFFLKSLPVYYVALECLLVSLLPVFFMHLHF